MRISDWRSDVCASDRTAEVRVEMQRAMSAHAGRGGGGRLQEFPARGAGHSGIPGTHRKLLCLSIGRASGRGRSVSSRVALGGRRIINNENIANHTNCKAMKTDRYWWYDRI